MPDIAMGFAARQTPESKFSHFDGTDEELIEIIKTAWDNRKEGYKPGILLVPVPPAGFLSSLVVLKEGDRLRGSYMPRKEGETPRKTYCLDSRKGITVPEGLLLTEQGHMPDKVMAQAVDIVLYHRDVLAEDGEEHEAEWLITSINASPLVKAGSMPMDPATLMANHFGDSGGTATGMSPEEFEDALRKSYWFWRDKTFAG